MPTKRFQLGRSVTTCCTTLELKQILSAILCHRKKLKPVECQVVFLENRKHEISFTPSRVGDHDLILFPLSPIKKTTAAQLLVNSPFLQENRRQISKQILSKPSAMAITRTGDLVVCETANDSITVVAGDDGKK